MGTGIPFEVEPLTGFTVGVTAGASAARRRDELVALLRRQGARVVEAPPAARMRRLVGHTVRREVQAVAFTSPPATTGFLEVALALGLRAEVLDALREGVLPVCLGPGCARPLEQLGVSVQAGCPDQGRLGSLVRTMVETLPTRNRELHIQGHELVLQGSVLLVAGDCLWLPPRPAAVLRVLAERPGRVFGRAELLRRVWVGSAADEHAVEAAVARLRSALGPYAGLVRTVSKRGYRLAVTS